MTLTNKEVQEISFLLDILVDYVRADPNGAPNIATRAESIAAKLRSSK
jgi:hypothetical protein